MIYELKTNNSHGIIWLLIGNKNKSIYYKIY